MGRGTMYKYREYSQFHIVVNYSLMLLFQRLSDRPHVLLLHGVF